MTVTRHDREGHLETIWNALASHRETCIPEGVPEYDCEWSEICDAMAWLQEDLEAAEGYPRGDAVEVAAAGDFIGREVIRPSGDVLQILDPDGNHVAEFQTAGRFLFESAVQTIARNGGRLFMSWADGRGGYLAHPPLDGPGN